MASNIVRVGQRRDHVAVGRHARVRPLQLLPDHSRGQLAPVRVAPHRRAQGALQPRLLPDPVARAGRSSSTRASDPRPADTPDVPWGQLLHDFTGQRRAARRGRHGGDDAPAPRPRGLEPARTGRPLRADLPERALLDEREGLGGLPPARRAAGALSQCADLRVAARRPRPGRADAGRAQHHARADGGAHARPHAGAHEHPDHLAGRACPRPGRRRPQPRAGRSSPTGSRAPTWIQT